MSFFKTLGLIILLTFNFLFPRDSLVKSQDGRANILIMGKAGGTHEGSDLTDTMMLVSVSLGKPGIVIVSIPRDLWIPEIRAKINSAYYWGSQDTPYFDSSKNEGSGIAFAKNVVEKVVGQQIQYGAVIDFSAFKDVVDAIGGIEVVVDNGFIDKLYPIAGLEDDLCGGDTTFACRYQTVSFDAGTQSMNGDRALIFVRSRHAEGAEGTDTAREVRQQKVIGAIKNKISDPKVFLSPKVDLAMLKILKKYVQTDIDGPTATVLTRIGLKSNKYVNQYLIPAELLVNPPISKTYDNQYVFIPKAGNGRWEEVNIWIQNVLR